MNGRRTLGWFVGFVLIAAVGSGCQLFTPRAARDLLDGTRKPVGPPPAVVHTDGETPLTYHTRLIDQPAGNDYLNAGLWADVTNPLNHEQTTLLAVNGLRLGVISSQPPRELERLATSEATCLSPTLRSAVAGQPKLIPVNGPIDRCRLGVTHAVSAVAESKKYELVECGLALTAAALPDDKLKVRGEFQIQHGERQPWLRPTADGSGFARTDQRASESYPALAFEVILNRSDLLVVGATDDPVEKLGQAFFFANSVDRIRQRVLLVQVGGAETGRVDSRSSAAQTRKGFLTAGR